MSSFIADVAWEICSIIRRRSLEYAQPVAIDISLANSQCFFHALSRPGTNLDNQLWITRKQKTVLRFGRASFYMGCKLRRQGRSIESAFYISENEYSIHGGGFPIRVRGTEGVVGVITVSGLRQDLDHIIVYESLKEYLALQQAQVNQDKGIEAFTKD